MKILELGPEVSGSVAFHVFFHFGHCYITHPEAAGEAAVTPKRTVLSLFGPLAPVLGVAHFEA
jgi:hypothetical protein